MRAQHLLIVVFTIPATGQLWAESQLPGFLPESVERELEAEAIIKATPDPRIFDRHFAYLTDEPHQTGTPRNMELADYVRDRFVEYGLTDVRFHDTPALVSYGRSASIEILEPDRLTLKLAEDAYPGDEHSTLYESGDVVPYHEYAMSGDVTAEVVYANSGSPEDFAILDELGIDVRDRIVLMRYSDPYSYRGYKVYMAESRGAAGAIIYSDPEDDGFAKGATYPDGPWGPPSHIQWGSIVYDWFGQGVTPFTFHWQQQADGTWVEGPVRDRQLPGIPSIPMSHEDAAEILSRLGGPEAPPEWQGGLPIPYRIGPGPVSIRMAIENEETIRTMRNVIGVIPGISDPEKWIILGNHRDAWIYGGVDPSGGTAALLEAARALGAAVRDGYRPKRSIVFANWDAEEDLLGGSTQWVLDNRDKLLEDGVVYINLDSGASGPDFGGGATPALADFLQDAAKALTHPDSGDSLYDAWAGRFESGVPEVSTIVGATDYTAFQANIGMSCLDLGMSGPYGVYHSQYDNYAWVSRFGDPGFKRNTMLAQTLGVLAWRLANVDVLPMRYSSYARKISEHIAEIEDKARPDRALELRAARVAAARWEAAAGEVEAALGNLDAIDAQSRERINELLLAGERALTEEQGLASRPFFKHLIYAPQPTYRDMVLPRLFEAVEAGDWDRIDDLETELVNAIDEATRLSEATRAAAAGVPR